MNYVDENKIFVGNGDTFYYTIRRNKMKSSHIK